MKNEKTLLLLLFVVLMIGLIGCSGGSNSGGSSTTAPPTPATNPLVGTWRNTAGMAGTTMTFNANGTGSISDGHPITSWTLNGSTLNITIPQPEVFKLTWDNAAQTAFTIVNQSPSGESSSWAKQ